jgi:hypothetical protein
VPSELSESITTVEALIREVNTSGNYAFLIGAGSSKPEPANISTGNELIKQWQKTCYSDNEPQIPLTDWVSEQEKSDMSNDQSQYGYWFERLHPTKGGRRDYIQQQVRDAKPTAGHVILASMMSVKNGGRSVIPVTLTPNFDDLLVDSFYLYLEETPQLINHGGVVPAFRLTREEPTIVKLHGDYLYDNLKNVDDETRSLENRMESLLQETISEHGLVVVGYSGRDDSIMRALKDAEEYSDHGIYWCTYAPGDDDVIESLSSDAHSLLEQTPSQIVPIEGFVPLMFKFGRNIDGVNIPLKNELIEQAGDRADELLANVAEHVARELASQNKSKDQPINALRSLGNDLTSDEISEFTGRLCLNLLEHWIDNLSVEELTEHLGTNSRDDKSNWTRSAVRMSKQLINDYELLERAETIDNKEDRREYKSTITTLLDLNPEDENLERQLKQIGFEIEDENISWNMDL